MVRALGVGLLIVGAAAACGERDGDTMADDESGTASGETGETGEAAASDEPSEDEVCRDVLPPKTLAPEDANAVCDVQGEHRSCKTRDDAPGTQFCDLEGLEDWGDCLTTYACTPGDYDVCFFCSPEFGTMLAYCHLVAGAPEFDDEACITPLVLRFDERPVEYVASADHFPMTAGEVCSSTDWPSAATPWLALDRDGNGSIDGGHELFGSGTAIGSTFAIDGFAALAVLDSDGDRRISPADARWSELLLWADHDHDRRSGPWELETLASRGATAIELEYSRTGSRCDGRGNCEGERASVSRAGRPGAEVIDVRLACQ